MYVVNALQSFLDWYQFRYILSFPLVSVLQDTTQSLSLINEAYSNTVIKAEYF